MSWTTADIPDQRGRVAVVTGANGGLGLETARALAAAGATVVVAARNPGKTDRRRRLDHARTHPTAELDVVALDLGSLDSVHAAAATIVERHPRIDILVNNAGLMGLPEQATADGFEMQFGVNHLGHFVLTHRLLPSIAASAGRVVTVTSTAHHMGRNVDPDNPHLHGTLPAVEGLRAVEARQLPLRARAAPPLAGRRLAGRQPPRPPRPVEHRPADPQRRGHRRRVEPTVLRMARRPHRHVRRPRRAAPAARRHRPAGAQRPALRAALRQQRRAGHPPGAAHRRTPRRSDVVDGVRARDRRAVRRRRNARARRFPRRRDAHRSTGPRRSAARCAGWSPSTGCTGRRCPPSPARPASPPARRTCTTPRRRSCCSPPTSSSRPSSARRRLGRCRRRGRRSSGSPRCGSRSTSSSPPTRRGRSSSSSSTRHRSPPRPTPGRWPSTATRSMAAAADLGEHLVRLPLDVIYDLAIAPAVRVVANGTRLTRRQRADLADACWRAISR